MLTIIVMSQKGGTGKSAIAAGIAVESMSARGGTFVIDIDPQCSASKWGDRRGEASEPPVTATHAARLPRIRETCLEGGVERLIIDTPAGCGPSVIDAAKVADIAIIPTGPHHVEIETLEATIQAAKVAGAPAAVVITRAERGHPDINHAQKYIRTLDATLCPDRHPQAPHTRHRVPPRADRPRAAAHIGSRAGDAPAREMDHEDVWPRGPEMTAER